MRFGLSGFLRRTSTPHDSNDNRESLLTSAPPSPLRNVLNFYFFFLKKRQRFHRFTLRNRWKSAAIAHHCANPIAANDRVKARRPTTQRQMKTARVMCVPSSARRCTSGRATFSRVHCTRTIARWISRRTRSWPLNGVAIVSMR